MQKHNTLKKIAMLCIALLLVITAWGRLFSAPASSQQEQSRINALEVDINYIESRLNRIENQLNQLFRSESPRAPLTAPRPSPRRNGQQGPSSNPSRNQLPLNREQMFDRLATLVIETKQQLNKLEARVSKLESRRTPSTKR
jgi:tetrahydromethanopterin S-methyltransferase subunit B